MPTEMISEDWRSDPVKYTSDQKLSLASSVIGECFGNPTITNLRNALNHANDYITHLPTGNEESNLNKRNSLIEKLDEIMIIVFGDSKDENVKKILAEHNIKTKQVRHGMSIVTIIDNVPDVAKMIRNVLIEAGDFATNSGLRIMLHRKKKYGMQKILEEENIENLEI